MPTNQHVTYRSDGKWQVKGEGAARATALFDTKREATAKAREIAKNQQSELFVHNKDGKIGERNSYGSDPCPPRG